MQEQILRERNNNYSMRKDKFRITYSFLFNKVPTGNHKNLYIKAFNHQTKNRGNENTGTCFNFFSSNSCSYIIFSLVFQAKKKNQ